MVIIRDAWFPGGSAAHAIAPPRTLADEIEDWVMAGHGCLNDLARAAQIHPPRLMQEARHGTAPKRAVERVRAVMGGKVAISVRLSAAEAQALAETLLAAAKARKLPITRLLREVGLALDFVTRLRDGMRPNRQTRDRVLAELEEI